MKQFLKNKLETFVTQGEVPGELSIYVIFEGTIYVLNDGFVLESFSRNLWDQHSELNIFFGSVKQVEKWIESNREMGVQYLTDSR